MSWIKCPTCPRSFAPDQHGSDRCYWCRNGLELLGTIQSGGVFVATTDVLGAIPGREMEDADTICATCGRPIPNCTDCGRRKPS